MAERPTLLSQTRAQPGTQAFSNIQAPRSNVWGAAADALGDAANTLNRGAQISAQLTKRKQADSETAGANVISAARAATLTHMTDVSTWDRLEEADPRRSELEAEHKKMREMGEENYLEAEYIKRRDAMLKEDFYKSKVPENLVEQPWFKEREMISLSGDRQRAMDTRGRRLQAERHTMIVQQIAAETDGLTIENFTPADDDGPDSYAHAVLTQVEQLTGWVESYPGNDDRNKLAQLRELKDRTLSNLVSTGAIGYLDAEARGRLETRLRRTRLYSNTEINAILRQTEPGFNKQHARDQIKEFKGRISTGSGDWRADVAEAAMVTVQLGQYENNSVEAQETLSELSAAAAGTAFAETLRGGNGAPINNQQARDLLERLSPGADPEARRTSALSMARMFASEQLEQLGNNIRPEHVDKLAGQMHALLESYVTAMEKRPEAQLSRDPELAPLAQRIEQDIHSLALRPDGDLPEGAIDRIRDYSSRVKALQSRLGFSSPRLQVADSTILPPQSAELLARILGDPNKVEVASKMVTQLSREFGPDISVGIANQLQSNPDPNVQLMSGLMLLLSGESNPEEVVRRQTLFSNAFRPNFQNDLERAQQLNTNLTELVNFSFEKVEPHVQITPEDMMKMNFKGYKPRGINLRNYAAAASFEAQARGATGEAAGQVVPMLKRLVTSELAALPNPTPADAQSVTQKILNSFLGVTNTTVIPAVGPAHKSDSLFSSALATFALPSPSSEALSGVPLAEYIAGASAEDPKFRMEFNQRLGKAIMDHVLDFAPLDHTIPALPASESLDYGNGLLSAAIGDTNMVFAGKRLWRSLSRNVPFSSRSTHNWFQGWHWGQLTNRDVNAAFIDPASAKQLGLVPNFAQLVVPGQIQSEFEQEINARNLLTPDKAKEREAYVAYRTAELVRQHASWMQRPDGSIAFFWPNNGNFTSGGVANAHPSARMPIMNRDGTPWIVSAESILATAALLYSSDRLVQTDEAATIASGGRRIYGRQAGRERLIQQLMDSTKTALERERALK